MATKIKDLKSHLELENLKVDNAYWRAEVKRMQIANQQHKDQMRLDKIDCLKELLALQFGSGDIDFEEDEEPKEITNVFDERELKTIKAKLLNLVREL